MALAAQEQARAQASRERRKTDPRVAEAKTAFIEYAQTIPSSWRQAVLAEMTMLRGEKATKGYYEYQAELAAIRELDVVLKPQRAQEQVQRQEPGHVYTR